MNHPPVTLLVWIQLDPRNGETTLSPAPKDACHQLELPYASCLTLEGTSNTAQALGFSILLNKVISAAIEGSSYS